MLTKQRWLNSFWEKDRMRGILLVSPPQHSILRDGEGANIKYYLAVDQSESLCLEGGRGKICPSHDVFEFAYCSLSQGASARLGSSNVLPVNRKLLCYHAVRYASTRAMLAMVRALPARC